MGRRVGVDARRAAFYMSNVFSPFSDKTSKALSVMLALLAVPYVAPGLARFRVTRAPWDRAVAVAETEAAAAAAVPTPTPQPAQGEASLKASKNEATVTNALPDAPLPAKAADARSGTTAPSKSKVFIAIEDETTHALDAFYTSLAKTRAKKSGAVTRILHYGDSVITSDYISGTLRRKLQTEFGDAGHGFILIANPWEWYFHNDVAHGSAEGWNSSRMTGPNAKDGMYGVGSVSFTGTTGASAFFGTAERGSYGKKVSRFDVYYLETVAGGELEVKIGMTTSRFSTKGEDKVSRVQSFPVPDGEAKLTLRVVAGTPRLFGVALERDEPGVIYDALGANGARAESLASMNSAHFREQMALRKPALIVLQYGTNESEAPGIAQNYEATLGSVVGMVKAAAPFASILIAAPLDRAEAVESGTLRTKPVIKKLIAAQKSVAKASGIAFWNTFEAMGGEGSMAKWVKAGLGGSDLTHPSTQGAEIIGDHFAKALTAGFELWRATHPDAAK